MECLMIIRDDDELDVAIKEVHEILSGITDLETESTPRLELLSDAIWEYEQRTDILNRPSSGENTHG